MAESCQEILDPRIRRTRQLLQDALARLLETKQFEKISVQDITDAATLNRATFYDHYVDKFSLLNCLVSARFQQLLAERGVRFDGTCTAALKALVLGVCDYLAATPGVDCEGHQQMEPHMESAVIGVVRWMMLDGLKNHPTKSGASPEMIATAVSWAIYGAAKEWVRTPNRCRSEEIVETVAGLVTPMFASISA